jgi:hypothetical protein
VKQRIGVMLGLDLGMRRSRAPAPNCCSTSGTDSWDCDVWGFKAERHLQSGTQCFGPEVCMARQGCLRVPSICTTASHAASEIHRWMARIVWALLTKGSIDTAPAAVV